MVLKKKTTYLVVTHMMGDVINAWYPTNTLKQALRERKDFMSSSTNDWNYPIVKEVTTRSFVKGYNRKTKKKKSKWKRNLNTQRL